MKEELGRKVTNEFAALRAKTCSYLIGNSNEDEKQKAQKYAS